MQTACRQTVQLQHGQPSCTTATTCKKGPLSCWYCAGCTGGCSLEHSYQRGSLMARPCQPAPHVAPHGAQHLSPHCLRARRCSPTAPDMSASTGSPPTRSGSRSNPIQVSYCRLRQAVTNKPYSLHPSREPEQKLPRCSWLASSQLPGCRQVETREKDRRPSSDGAQSQCAFVRHVWEAR